MEINGYKFYRYCEQSKKQLIKTKKKKWLNGADNNTAVYNNASETEQENGT